MKRELMLLVSSFALAIESRAEVLPPDVMVARFKGDCRAAVSLTFDDALTSHVETVIPLLDRYGLKGTFFLLISNIRPGGPSTWDDWRKAVAGGHEAGSHSLTHPRLSQLHNPRQLRDEIEGSADRIEEQLGVRPTAFAYPESDHNDAVRHQVLSVYPFDRSDCRVWGGQGFTVEDGVRHLEQALERKEWFSCMLHGVGETTWGPIDPSILDGLAAYLASHREKLWTGTYSHVAAYVRKRNVARVSLRDVTDGGFFFRLAVPKDADLSGLPPIPLTVKIALDGRDGSRARGQLNGQSLDLVPSACGNYLLAELEPDGRWVQILWK